MRNGRTKTKTSPGTSAGTETEKAPPPGVWAAALQLPVKNVSAATWTTKRITKDRCLKQWPKVWKKTVEVKPWGFAER